MMTFANGMMNFAMAESFSVTLLGLMVLVLYVLVLNIIIRVKSRE